MFYFYCLLGSNLSDKEFNYILEKTTKNYDNKINIQEFDTILHNEINDYSTTNTTTQKDILHFNNRYSNTFKSNNTFYSTENQYETFGNSKINKNNSLQWSKLKEYIQFNTENFSKSFKASNNNNDNDVNNNNDDKLYRNTNFNNNSDHTNNANTIDDNNNNINNNNNNNESERQSRSPTRTYDTHVHPLILPGEERSVSLSPPLTPIHTPTRRSRSNPGEIERVVG